MTQALNSKPLETGEDIDTQVKKLTKEIDSFDNFTTVAGFTGAAVGSLLAIPLGPGAFVAGSAIGVIAAVSVKLYADIKKKEINQEISNLKKKNNITPEEAETFKARLDLIHTEKIQKSNEESENKILE